MRIWNQEVGAESLRREPAVFAFCLEKNKVTTVLSSKLHLCVSVWRRWTGNQDSGINLTPLLSELDEVMSVNC